MNEKKPLGFHQYILLIIFAIGLWTGLNNLEKIILGLKKLITMMLPLVIGGCLAFVLNVPMSALERAFARGQQRRGKPIKTGRNATISLVITILATLLVVAFAVYIVVPQLVNSFSGLGVKVQNFYPQAIAWLQGLGVDTTSIQEFVEDFDILRIVTKISNDATLAGGAQSVLNAVVGTASTVITSLTTFFIGAVIALYLLAMKRQLGAQCTKILYAYVKTSVVDRIMRVAGIFYKTYANFISGQCVEACILGLLFYIVLNLFRFPYAATISVLIAMFALLPYLGAFLSCVIGAFLVLMDSPAHPMRTVLFIVVYLVVQQCENQLIYPRVVGKSVGLPPIWTLLAALVGANVMGVLGVLFFIPLTSVFYQLLRESVYKRLSKKHVAAERRAQAAFDDPPEKPQQSPPEEAEVP